MSIDWPKFWFSERELKNNDFNPELKEFLKDDVLSEEEADVLTDMFKENKVNVILVSKYNLGKLRSIIWSNSRVNYITNRDKKKVASYVPREYDESERESFSDLSKHIDENWILKNVSRLRLDQIVWPSEKIKFSINLSNNSIYKSHMDWNTYNVVWWKDVRNWKHTYIFEDWPLRWKRVMISNWDQLLEYWKLVTSSRVDKRKTIEYTNISKRNIDFIKWLKLPNNYKKIALEFAWKLKSREVLTRKTPIALVDSSKKEMLYTINWKSIRVPVLLWKNWLTYGWYSPNDKKTPAWKIHRFNPSISKIANSVNWDASNSWHSKTVKWASLQSNTSIIFGWRYFHWVAQYRIDWRNKWMWTWWCVWVDVDTIRKMYRDIKKNWIGYWYVS